MDGLVDFWTFSGALSRSGFWARCAVLSLAVTLVLIALPTDAGLGLHLPLTAASGSSMLALAVRRLRDRDLSPLWLAVVLLPLAGIGWLFWQLALRGSATAPSRTAATFKFAHGAAR